MGNEVLKVVMPLEEGKMTTYQDVASAMDTGAKGTVGADSPVDHEQPHAATRDKAVTHANKERPSECQRLEEVLRDSGIEIFADQFGKMWASIPTNGGTENAPVPSERFMLHVIYLYYTAFREPCSRGVVRKVTDVLAGEAQCSGTKRHLSYRVTRDGKNILIDMGTRDRSAIEVSTEGWRLVQREKSPFKRFPHMKALPHPEKGGSLKELFDVLPIKDPATRDLISVWLPSMLVPEVPRASLIFHGPSGSGKTSTAEKLRNLVDPSVTLTSNLPRNDEELIQQLGHHYLPVFDNLRSLQPWASNVLCRATTGLGHQKRALYTDDDDYSYSFNRSFILSGIPPLSQAEDLLDRCLYIELERITPREQKSLESLDRDYNKIRPAIFHAMLDALVGAMQIRKHVTLPFLPRLADWFQWCAAISDVIGIGRDRFISAFYENEKRRRDIVQNARGDSGTKETLRSGRLSARVAAPDSRLLELNPEISFANTLREVSVHPGFGSEEMERTWPRTAPVSRPQRG
jgi:hypothetical protein